MGEPLRRTATAIADIVVGDLSMKDLLPESTICKIEQEVRLAVEAETERAAKVNPESVECPDCGTEVGQLCRTNCGCGIFCTCPTVCEPHDARWRAAIRKPPEGSK